MNRGVAVLAAALLAGCEPAFDVDFVANAPVDGSAVTLRLDGVNLRKQDNGRESRLRSAVGEYRFQRDSTVTPSDLLSNSDISGGEYSGIRIDFATDAGNVVRSGVATEFIEIGTVEDAAVAFMIDDDEDDRVSLTVALDLILSLRENPDEAGFILDPLIRAMERGDAASVTGTVSATVLTGPACTAQDASRAVYAFAGADITPDERDGRAAEPIAVSELSGVTLPTYRIDHLPPGPYTLALTCQSRLENGAQPALDGAEIDFLDGTREVSLDAGEQARLDFP